MDSTAAASARVVAAYDEKAGNWDAGAGFRSPQFETRLRRLLMNLLAPAAGRALAVELGVGTGWLLKSTAPLFGSVRAIDASARMLEICRARIAAEPLGNVSVELGDAMTLDGIADRSVDAIYTIGLLHVVPDAARVLSACARVLKPGGVLAVSMPNGACPWHALRDRLSASASQDLRLGRHYTPAGLVAAARAAGLIATNVVTWGAAPQQLSFRPAIAALNAGESLARWTGLSNYLGVLTAAFRR
jgi:ubiquinone/menaquinone biosynthesis C-methylase UbiE